MDYTAVDIKAKAFQVGDDVKIKTSLGCKFAMFFKPVPSRSAEDDDVDPAKKTLLTRPVLFDEGTAVRAMFRKLRVEFGDIRARQIVCDR